MSDLFLDALSAISGADFDEIPVPLEEFVSSEQYLNAKPLSYNQLIMAKAMSQIYRLDTLQAIYGEKEGKKIHGQTYFECVLCLAKGSGKNRTTSIAVLYVVYQLLCLKDPAHYYGKDKGNNIDILNMAINADQARNAFFNPLKALLKNCSWFDNKYELKQKHIEFDKNINLYSGNSEHGAAEGLNIFMVVLDEIAGVDEEGGSKDRLKTADGIYKALRATVRSRFPEYGKIAMLSFPRYKNDFIDRKYNEVVAEKEVTVKTHTFKIDPSLPDGISGNEFTIEWEEDHILRYTYPNTFALRRPTWEVNPLAKIEHYMVEFMTDPDDALTRFCALPSERSEDRYFKDNQAIEDALSGINGVDENGVFLEDWQPKKGADYYIHVDLSKVHDRCAVSVAHVDSWVQTEIAHVGYKQVHPLVVVDAIRWWKPNPKDPMDFKEVEDFIVAVRNRGFNIKLVTFDRWNSHDTINILNKLGFKTELLSVGNDHYDSFTTVMNQRRLTAPYIEQFMDELKALKWVKGKVDHPRSNYKDISDSVCGAIFNAVKHAKTPRESEVEVVTLDRLRAKAREEEEGQEQYRNEVIEAPSKKMPQGLEDYFNADAFKII